MSEEIFDIVNERDEVIGRLPRRGSIATATNTAPCMSWSSTRGGNIFLQKRSMTKDTFPAHGTPPPPAMWTAARITTPAPCANWARKWA